MTKAGVKPTMKSRWVNSKEILADDDWIYPPSLPTLKERRQVFERVAEIGSDLQELLLKVWGEDVPPTRRRSYWSVRDHVCS